MTHTNKFKRVITIITDSVGIGHAKDAKDYNDSGANTLLHLDKNLSLNLPTWEKLGLGNLEKFDSIKEVKLKNTLITTLEQTATGKDSVTGHWELMGATLKEPFNDFTPNGFPNDLLDKFSELTNRQWLCGKSASGTKVISEYYEQHVKTKGFIIYTSVDSTFQIAANEDIIPLEELYEACEIARKLTNDDLKPQWKVSRVIARPFIGNSKDNLTRTSNRHDYSLSPFKTTALDVLINNDVKTYGVGKIADLFNKKGLSSYEYSENNNDGMDKTIELVKNDEIHEFIFTNLVDFDSSFGHPRDKEGYKRCLEEFDFKLNMLLKELKDDDLLIITSDHGNDPYYKGNDHTRENVPFIAFNKNLVGKQINSRSQFSDVGQTICDNFGLHHDEGESFLNDLEIKI